MYFVKLNYGRQESTPLRHFPATRLHFDILKPIRNKYANLVVAAGAVIQQRPEVLTASATLRVSQ